MLHGSNARKVKVVLKDYYYFINGNYGTSRLIIFLCILLKKFYYDLYANTKFKIRKWLS